MYKYTEIETCQLVQYAVATIFMFRNIPNYPRVQAALSGSKITLSIMLIVS